MNNNKPMKRPDFDAIYTKELLDTKAIPNFNESNPLKRVMLATLSRSSNELMDTAITQPEVFADMLNAVNQAHDQLEAEYELAEAAQARLLWVGAYVVEQLSAKGGIA